MADYCAPAWLAPPSLIYHAADSDSAEGLPDDLRASEQTIATMLDANYWVAMCPWLHCCRDSSLERAAAEAALAATLAAMPSSPLVVVALVTPTPTSPPPINAGVGLALTASPPAPLVVVAVVTPAPTPLPLIDVPALRARMLQNGYFKVGAAALAHPAGLTRALEAGVLRLASLGHAPSAIQNYDESWTLAAACAPLCEAATGNKPNGDWFSFLVSPGVHQFSGPHRDKPASGPSSFRPVSGGEPSGSPMYCTAWISLSDATPTNSCLYFVPACRDPGYLLPGDAIREGLPGPAAWGNVVAQPCEPGALLVFSHRLLHWGSAAEDNAAPRVSMSFALADPAFESGPYFNAAEYLPYPPLALRLSLRAGQGIAYNAQAPLSKAQLALDNRVFMSGARFFSAAYVEKIGAAAQQIKFDMAAQRLAQHPRTPRT